MSATGWARQVPGIAIFKEKLINAVSYSDCAGDKSVAQEGVSASQDAAVIKFALTKEGRK